MPKWDAVKCSVFFGVVNPFSSLKLSFGELGEKVGGTLVIN